MIDIFTKEQFEAALPVSKTTGNKLWKYEGFFQGEHCYSVSIDDKSKVFIRSSIGFKGMSADTGEDSIRIFLVNDKNISIGSKINKYTKRTKGWQKRMTDICRYLFRLRRKAGDDPDGNPNIIKKVVKESANKGRFFINKPWNPQNSFEWLTDNKGNLI
jgi:hypothetical protein